MAVICGGWTINWRASLRAQGGPMPKTLDKPESSPCIILSMIWLHKLEVLSTFHGVHQNISCRWKHQKGVSRVPYTCLMYRQCVTWYTQSTNTRERWPWRQMVPKVKILLMSTISAATLKSIYRYIYAHVTSKKSMASISHIKEKSKHYTNCECRPVHSLIVSH